MKQIGTTSTTISLVFLTIVSLGLQAFAANESPQTFTLDGRLYQAGTTSPLLDGGAKITVQIINPTGTCLLYEEQQTVNTVSTEGRFTINVGSPTGNAKRTVNDPGRSMAQIFQNIAAISANSVPGQTCAGSSYTPAAGAVRYFRLIVTPSTTNTPDTLSPDIAVDSVPNAVVAQSVQGLERAGILQVNNTGSVALSQVNLEALFTTPAYSNLQSILAGNFMHTDASGATLPSYASTPAGVSAGDIWYDTTTNQIKYQSNTGVQTVGGGGGSGTISSLTVSSSMSMNGSTASSISSGAASIDLSNTGITAGTYTKLTVDAKGRATAGTVSLVEADIPNLTTAGKVSGNTITSGTISGSASINTSGNLVTTGTVSGQTVQASTLRLYNNSNYVQLTAGTISGNLNFVWPTDQGTNGQVLSTDNSGNLSWITPTAGTLAGDVSGAIGSNSVDKIKGKAISAGSATNQLMIYDGTQWVNSVVSGDGTLSSAGALSITRVNGSVITSGTISGSTAINTSGNLITTGTVGGQTVQASAFRLYNGSNYVQLTAGTLAGNLNFVWPTTQGTNGQVLSTDNSGNLSWATVANTLAGDVSGALGTNSVDKIKGKAVTAGSVSGQLMIYDGTQWANAVVSGDATLSYAGILSLNKVPVSKGGTNATTFGNSHVIVSNGTGSALQDLSCSLNQVISFDASGYVTCANVSALSGAILNGGNSTAAAISIGTNDNQPLQFKANNSTAMTISQGGNVGIGTTTPGVLLHVKGGTATTVGRYEAGCSGCDVTLSILNNESAIGNSEARIAFSVTNGSDIRGMVSGKAAGSDGWLVFSTSNAGNVGEKMRIDGQGNVGIARTSPSTALDISGAFNLNGIAAPSVSPSNEGRIYFDRSAGKFKVSQNGAAYVDLVSSASTAFSNGGNAFGSNASLGTTDNRPLAFITNNTTAMTISQGGKVGIGTASPAEALAVAGNIALPTANSKITGSTGLTLEETGDTYGAVRMYLQNRMGVNGALFEQAGSVDLVDFVYKSLSYQRNIRFESRTGGQAYAAVPEFQFGTAGDSTFAIGDYGAYLVKGKMGILMNNPTTALHVNGNIASTPDAGRTLGTAAFRFTDIYATGSIIATSDVRAKRDIEESDLGLDFVNDLRPVSYRWKAGPDTTSVHYGLIAQDTESVLSEVRSEKRGPAAIVNYDKETDRYGIRYTELISPIIKAIQELYQKVVGIESETADLKARLQKAEQENAALKAYLCAKDPSAPICQ